MTFKKVSGAKEYEIYRSTKEKSGYKKIGKTKSTGYWDKSTKKGRTYYYKIKAKGKTSAQNSLLSKEYAKVKVLAAPTVKGSAAKSGIVVTWKKVTGARGYKIYLSSQKGKDYKVVKTINKSATKKAVVKAPKNVRKVYVKVRAFYKQDGGKVYGAYSKPVAVKIRK